MAEDVRSPREVLDFWLGEVGEAGWYEPPEELDGRVRDLFEDTWVAALEGRLGLWLTAPLDALAYVILLDQFPRNMFRGDALSFASDRHARAAAKTAIAREWDLRVPTPEDRHARAAAKTAIAREWDLRVPAPERQFLYMPLEHSENLVDQDRAVRLFKGRMPEAEDLLLHARAHREQIRTFGRFPSRNAALGRPSTPEEERFLAEGGYRTLVERMRAA